MRRKSRWDRFVIGLKSSFDVKSRRRRQSRRMFLEPLEARQLLAADLYIAEHGDAPSPPVDLAANADPSFSQIRPEGEGDGYGSASGSGSAYASSSGGGYGDGYGMGSGYGSASGSGSAYGWSSGGTYGDGDGMGSGYGSASGSGSAYASSSGGTYGDGYGMGSGSGSASGGSSGSGYGDYSSSASASADDYGGSDWVQDLLTYDEMVSPSSDPSMPSIYETLDDVPLDWEAAIETTTSDSPQEDLAADMASGVATDLPTWEGDYSVDTLAGTSWGMMDTEEAGLPSSVIETIGTFEAWDAEVQQSVQAFGGFDETSAVDA
ncbi:MAG: hypothetical protein ABI614_28145, partial [Planctomycetota bacterium]